MTGVQGGVLDETDIRSQVRILEDELKRHKVSVSYKSYIYSFLPSISDTAVSTAPTERGTSAL
jgi:hypothetical protein